MNRRTVLQGAVAGAAMLPTATLRAAPASAPIKGAGQASDEAYWAQIAAQYDVTDAVIQLENGNWGMMSRPVLAAYQQCVARVNRESSYYARRGMGADLGAAHARLASFLGVEREEIVLTRNATEALKALIGGYNRIKPGQAALYADLDYDSMQASLEASMARRGARTIKIALPEPATYQNVIDAYAQAFETHPDIKLVLLTHISHRTGLKIPVREISALAQERGIDIIVDAAHSLGQVELDIAGLGADFVGINLHKWMGAPLGVGAAYIRKGRVSAIDPDIADEVPGSGSIRSRVHTGTVDFAATLTLPAALDFQATIGAAAKTARLQALRDRWVGQLRDLPGIEVLTPDDPRMHGGITSFRLSGRTSEAENKALAATLLDRFGIFTVHRTGLASGACVRATPALFNSMADVDALAAALKQIV
ncbi:aminotransferase class V-fold PLP-dependent enzyme [Parasphingorhabdus sp.]|uniref:aminotransferase class V-fold PLP-dependent enzyme n=1 Tax=Parasphingorhabdus sp. TaxID=2709688 RepID=UPI0039E37771